MPNLKEVRNRISSVQSTQQITKAMKMVAAAKLRRAQDRITGMRPYSERLEGIMRNLTANTSLEELNSPFVVERDPEKVLIIAITSDRGLCGAFNANIIKTSMTLAKEKYAEQFTVGKVSFLPLGKKAYDAFRRSSLDYDAKHFEIFQNLDFNEVKKVGDEVLENFIKEEYDRVEIIYNEFKNVATQIIRTKQFLPIVANEEGQEDSKSESRNDYILEPSQEAIIQDLLPSVLKITLYSAILESNASEHGARMTAMDKATENAGELLKELKLTYNRSRQAAITTEILEIVAGAEALGSS